jgi:hypothetical protein
VKIKKEIEILKRLGNEHPHIMAFEDVIYDDINMKVHVFMCHAEGKN